MSSEWVAVMAAAMGAGGAVLAQLIGSVFTARRESKRLEWEKSAKQQEWDHQQGQRFLDQKRDLYGQYLGLTYKLGNDLSPKLEEESRTGQYQTLSASFSEHADDLDALRWTLNLIAPAQVRGSIELTYVHVVLAHLVYYRPDKYSSQHRKRTAASAMRAWHDMHSLMRADLDSDPNALDRTARALRGRTRPSADGSPSEEHAKIKAKIDELRDVPNSFPPAKQEAGDHQGKGGSEGQKQP